MSVQSQNGKKRELSSRLSLLDLFRHRRNHVEEVPNHAHIGNLEDGSLRVFVDRNNRPRALHADDVLDRPADPQRKVELRRDRLARRLPICRSSGSQPLSQMGREAATSPPSALASSSASARFFCSLIPRPTATMTSDWERSTACLASWKTSCGVTRGGLSATAAVTFSTGADPASA